jgi:hypothetical protein
MESRNKAQVEADDALTLAMENCIKAYMPEYASAYTLTDFVVLTALQRLDESGIVVTQHPMFMSNGDIPWYRILGLIEIHSLKARKEISVGNDNG